MKGNAVNPLKNCCNSIDFRSDDSESEDFVQRVVVRGAAS